MVTDMIKEEVDLLRGVKEEALELSDKLKQVRNVLDDADRRGFDDRSVKQWLKRLEHASYEMDDVLDEYISFIKPQMEQRRHASEAPPAHKACPSIQYYSSCSCFKKVSTRHDIALKIKKMKAKLDKILEEEKQFGFLKNQGGEYPSTRLERVTTSFVDVAEVEGRDVQKDMLVRKLIEDSANARQEDRRGLIEIQMTSIVGTGGIGKTTLAQLAYNDNRVKDCFPLRIWICVLDPFDEAKIAREIVEQVRGSCPEIKQLEILLKLVKDSVSEKKFLLVLDDVWAEKDNNWVNLMNSLKHGAVGSSILVTTRNEKVAIMMGTAENKILRLDLLSDEDCWKILYNIAFLGRNEKNLERFQETGKKIANKCRGLPLVAKVLGSLLRLKNTLEAWENVLRCSETWQFQEAKEYIFPHLALSYNDLSPAQRRCFSYCAVLPKDHAIYVDKLIRNWIALGYVSSNGDLESDLELRGREYFDNLAMRSLFQDFVKDGFGEIINCKMHDIVHEFCRSLRESDDLKHSSGGEEVATMLKKTSGCPVCDPLSISHSREYRSLFLQAELFSPHICDHLTSLRVLRLRGDGLRSLRLGPTEIEKLIHLRDLDLTGNKVDVEDLKSICKIYTLLSLVLSVCGLEEIPTEIENLSQLRHLDLSSNGHLRKLPDSICKLIHLRTLDFSSCSNLSELPKDINKLVNLKCLYTGGINVDQYPQGLAELTGLQVLSDFRGGQSYNSLGILKKLNRLSRKLDLHIRLSGLGEDVVQEAREAELVEKRRLQDLLINFKEYAPHIKEEPLCMDIVDALRPHSHLQKFRLANFRGFELPSWIVSPNNQLRNICINDLRYCSSLLPFGILPCLETFCIHYAPAVEIVGREFLGITSSTSCTTVGFPKLKRLEMHNCPNLKEWEDITAKEEKSATFSVLPCLTYWAVGECRKLTMLPHRLLRKASLLEELELTKSTQLIELYVDEEDPLRILRSDIPKLRKLTWREGNKESKSSEDIYEDNKERK